MPNDFIPYIPFGPEWEKHMMELPRKVLVEMLRDQFKKGIPTQPIEDLSNTITFNDGWGD